MDQHHHKHNKPTAPPPPTSTKPSDNPPSYDSVNTTKQNSVISTLIQAACVGGNNNGSNNDNSGATAETIVTKTVSDHSIHDTNLGTLEQDDDGWMKVKGSNDHSNNEVKRDSRKPATSVILDKDYILVAMTVPGLKLKKFSLRKTPTNCSITKSEFINHNTVRIEFVLSGRSGDIVYKYDNVDRPFKSDVTEEGSVIKFDVDKIRWKIRKC